MLAATFCHFENREYPGYEGAVKACSALPWQIRSVKVLRSVFVIDITADKHQMAGEGKLGPCMQCVRCMLFVFNGLFWVGKA